MLENLSRSFVRAKSSFFMLNPNPYGLFKFPWMRWVMLGHHYFKEAWDVSKNNKPLADAIGNSIGNSIVHRCVVNHGRAACTIGHRWSSRYIPMLNVTGLGAVRRSWIDSIDKGPDGRIVKKMTIIYHHANRAGQPNQRRILLILLVSSFFVMTFCYFDIASYKD